MSRIPILLTTLFLVIAGVQTLQAQEYLTGTSSNAQLENQKASSQKSNGEVRLPFRDDFSVPSIYPMGSLWADRFAFINHDYPVDPMTVGVATLDAINDTGAVYNHAGAFSFIADYLTTNPIRLDSLFTGIPRTIKRSDSLYLSFFFQPQGIGNQPNEDDSLVLEFYNGQSSSWQHIWSSPGMSLNDFTANGGAPFKQVIIPITDSASYFRSDFRFRFYNYTSLSNNSIPSWGGNVDHWHLDYVYLNVNRSVFDTVYNDVGFASPAHSAIKGFTSIPWNQYNASPGSLMADSFHHNISNIDNVTYNTTYQYKVQEETGALVSSYSGGNINLSPFASSGYQSYQPHASPAINFSFPLLTDDTAFIITHVVEMVGNTDDLRVNDTIRFTQRFYNYFAYDDGTAEAGYGLSLTNGRVACQFELFQPDSLQAIQMFFNRTLNDGNVKFFYLTVWDDYQGHPGNILYEKQYQLPKFDHELNKYVTYNLDQAIWVTGTFYIGWRQTTSDNLNLGFDLNINSKDRNFFNTSGTWTNSLFNGSLMIRPVLGLEDEAHVGVEENEDLKVTVYPNPNHGSTLDITLHGAESGTPLSVFIHDATGRVVMQGDFSNSIDISGLRSGLYYVIINDGQRTIAREKLIVIR